MINVKLLLTGLIGWLSILGLATGEDAIIRCNYDPWYGLVLSNFTPSDIDSTLCTHLTYPVRFLITPSEEFRFYNIESSYYNMSDTGLISSVMKLKENSTLKVIAEVKFFKEAHEVYLEMAANDTKRTLFIETALSFVQEYGFDGLELDWQFPEQTIERDEEDKINFVKILEEIYAEFKPLNYEFSISVDGSTIRMFSFYHIPSITEHVDYINLMAFGFVQQSESKLIHDSPMWCPGKKDVFSVIDYWIREGASTTKFVLGIPFKGSCMTLPETSRYDLGDPLVAARPHCYSYNKICNNVYHYNYHRCEGEFRFYHHELISYNDEQIVSIKAKVANCLNFAGYAVVNINDDDFRGDCGKNYPLLRELYDNRSYKNALANVNSSLYTLSCTNQFTEPNKYELKLKS